MIRNWLVEAALPYSLENELRAAYQQMEHQIDQPFSVAVRSSATAEDLPSASFAGQQETYLNVSGINHILLAVKKVFASMFNDRAIAYRVHQGFAHEKVGISAGIQRMIRSDLGASGVTFTIDTETGFQDVVFITSAYGLGEPIVQGEVNPDEFYVHKPTLKAGKPAIIRRELGSKTTKMIYADPNDTANKVKTIGVDINEQRKFSLTDKDILQLAEQAIIIEEHYGKPMDIEWGKDGADGKIYILQARPETVVSQNQKHVIERYSLDKEGELIVTGRSVGQKIANGPAKVIQSVKEMGRVQEGDVLVTDMTDPDWEPIMKKAAAIVTNRGGRTCHAAIIARELGVPAIVGCGDATEKIKDNDAITISCAQGEIGYVYQGKLDFKVNRTSINDMPEIPFKITMNIANPERAFAFQKLPNAGVGLARLEFIISSMIRFHPKALLHFEELNKELQQQIKNDTAAYASPRDYFVEKLTEGVSTLAAAFYPKPVIVRLSDFKSNEYANLIGGHDFEPKEENPMLGFRGASRYIDKSFRECFELECEALKKVHFEMGLHNMQIMVPFVRTINEAKQVIALLKENGLERGVNDLKIIMMCEIPSNALLADQFLEYFDGFSIGSNDMTQLTLGLDRDSGLVAQVFDERDPAIKILLHNAISACNKAGKYIGICGQGPSDHADFAKWLVDEGIQSVSLNPDTIIDTWLYLAKNRDSQQ